MTEHDAVRVEAARECDRNDREAVADAVRGLQSTDDPDPAIMKLHDELLKRLKELDA